MERRRKRGESKKIEGKRKEKEREWNTQETKGGEGILTTSGYAVLLTNVTTPCVSPGRSRVSQHSYQSLCPTNHK